LFVEVVTNDGLVQVALGLPVDVGVVVVGGDVGGVDVVGGLVGVVVVCVGVGVGVLVAGGFVGVVVVVGVGVVGCAGTAAKS
jgi:hypothetical protein